MLSAVFFWVFALGALTSSLAVVWCRNPLFSALWLILDFFFFAGIYGLLSAHFMAILQILVYGGAIMVLFMFIIMLLNLRDEELGETQHSGYHVLGFFASAALCVFFWQALSPVMNFEAVDANRTETAVRHATSLERLQNEEERTRLESLGPEVRKSAGGVPGLFLDLNERALEEEFQRKLQNAADGNDNLVSEKYRRFEPGAPFVLPPSMVPKTSNLTADANISFGTVEPISMLIVNRYVVPFELTALLLLAAIVGAVIIAKRRV
jgi:NADH-quinone oxidoreductase subunit J